MSGKFTCSGFKDNFLYIDSFGMPFSFLLPHGQKMYKSLLGALSTIIIVVTVFSYAVYKWQLLVDKDEARIALNIEENYFNDTSSVIG